jgi:hypothetical protein
MPDSVAQQRELRLQPERTVIRPAASRDELEQAYRLVYNSYLQRGYIPPSPAGVRLTVFNAFPETVTFVSVLDELVVATVSVVPDTPVGLPMDEIYSAELRELRDAGRRLAEVTMLADRRRQIQRALPMLRRLMKSVFDYATLVLGASDLCITINPRHRMYYERFLFRSLGPLRSYPSVLQNPALARRLNLETAQQECQGNEELLEHFFRHRTPMGLLTNKHRMTADDLRHFFVELTPAFRDAPDQVIAHLRTCYPTCPWDEWHRSPAGTEWHPRG